MRLPAYTAPVEFTNTSRELFEEAGVKFAIRDQRTNHKTHGTLTEEQIIVSRDGIEAGLLAITWRRFPDATEAQPDYFCFVFITAAGEQLDLLWTVHELLVDAGFTAMRAMRNPSQP